MGDHEGWSTELPTEPGQYWFYGDDGRGTMGMDFNPETCQPPDRKLQYVDIHEVSNGLLFVTNGHFMAQHRFDPTVRREGWIGYWRRADLPPVPAHDPAGVFEEENWRPK